MTSGTLVFLLSPPTPLTPRTVKSINTPRPCFFAAFDVPAIDLLGDLKLPDCCYSVGALLLLSELLRCNTSTLQQSVLEAALVHKPRSAAAKDLVRSHSAHKFIALFLPVSQVRRAHWAHTAQRGGCRSSSFDSNCRGNTVAVDCLHRWHDREPDTAGHACRHAASEASA